MKPLGSVAGGGTRGLIALLLPLGVACGTPPDGELAVDEATGARPPLPDTLRIREPGLHPEGVEYDEASDRFLVSSVIMGSITQVHDDGTHGTFIEDEDLSTSLGIHIDAANGRLLVASADRRVTQDPEYAGQAKLGIYGLPAGDRVHMVDLGALYPEGRHLANDVTVAPDGAAYVTDSLSPVIYRVDPDGTASILVVDVRLSVLNGIDFHPDGYLLVASDGNETLFRVPLDAPEELSEVRLSEPVAADGLALRPNGDLVAVAPAAPVDGVPRAAVLLLRSVDGWSSADVVARAATPSRPTTVALRGDSVYAVNPHFSGIGATEPVGVFEIFRVDFR